jgi:hypothetical protein
MHTRSTLTTQGVSIHTLTSRMLTLHQGGSQVITHLPECGSLVDGLPTLFGQFLHLRTRLLHEGQAHPVIVTETE